MFNYLKYLLKIILYIIFYLIPRNKNIWLFRGFADKFIDNSKALFLYVNKEQPKIKAIWITSHQSTYNIVKSLNFECVMKRSFKGIYYSLLSKYQFYGDYNDFVTSAGAVTINLWHGTPLKKIEFDIKKGCLSVLFDNSLKSKINYAHIYRKPNYILSSSSFISDKCLQSAFKIRKDNCLNFGYPRNDCLFDKSQKIPNFKKKYNKCFIYLPTWRDSNKDFFSDANLNLLDLNDLMKEKNSLFLIKMHPATKLNVEIDGFSNILLLDDNVDLYSILLTTDVLITDYSSVFYDYMLLDKKIIFFPFDKEEYLKNREFYFDYEKSIPTKPILTFDELKCELFKDFVLDDRYRKIKSLAWTYVDGNSSKRIVNFFLKKTYES